MVVERLRDVHPAQPPHAQEQFDGSALSSAVGAKQPGDAVMHLKIHRCQGNGLAEMLGEGFSFK